MVGLQKQMKVSLNRRRFAHQLLGWGSLISRNSERYAREADLRFSLVRINEHLDGISLAGGEEDERRRVEMHLNNVLWAMRRLVSGLTNLDLGHRRVRLDHDSGAPILVAAPLYFAGKISFGTDDGGCRLHAGTECSLRWFVDNFSQIADWRATLQRVAGFRYALSTTEDLQEFETRITYADGPAGCMSVTDLKIVSPPPVATCCARRKVEMHNG